jgi:hypothetical protein
MSDTTLMALFQDIDPAAEGIEKLHEMGISDDRISVLSGVPVPERLLGRPPQHTFVPRLAAAALASGRRVSQLRIAELMPPHGRPACGDTAGIIPSR